MGRDEIYILKHKDLDVAMVKINPFSGRIEYVLEVYMPEELPVGVRRRDRACPVVEYACCSGYKKRNSAAA